MTHAVRDTVLTYLADHLVMTLATTGPDGPWAAAVFYASEGFDLYFLSSPRSRHARDLGVDPRAAVTIEEQYDDWRRIQGIQIEGTVTELQGGEREHAMNVYERKFPHLRDAGRLPIALAEAFGRIAWYRLAPSRVYFVDNPRGFGHRDEVDLAEKR